MSDAVNRKAQRLLDEGAVQVDVAGARVFRVEGNTGVYFPVVIGAHVRFCPCPSSVECSHIVAALEFDEALHRAAEGDTARLDELQAALGRRLVRDRAELAAIFDRL